MFDFNPIYFNIVVQVQTDGSFYVPLPFGAERNSTSYYIYSNLISLATTSFQRNYGVGYSEYSNQGGNLNPFGRLQNKTFSWYSNQGAQFQFNS